MRFLGCWAALWAFHVSGCASLPQADVRHSHAEIDLVEGATVVPAGPVDVWYQRAIGYSHVAAGDRVVLLVRHSDGRPEWLDSGNAEFLLVDLPALRDGSFWEVGKDVRVWFWSGSTWGAWAVGELRGSVRTHRRGGDLWTVEVDLSGRRVEVAGGLGTEPAELRLHHTFAAAPVPYEDFKRRYPPVTSWTR